MPGAGGFRADRPGIPGGRVPGLRHQRPAGGEKQSDRAGPDPGPHGPQGEDHQQLGAALPHLQGHRREGRRIQPDDPEGDGHGGRGLRRHADLPVRQGCPGDHPESSPGCDAPAGVFEPPAERQPGEPHGASGRDGGQRALHLPQDVPEGPGDQKSDRHGEHGDPSGQTFRGERAGGVDLRRGLPGILQEGDGHEPQPEGGCLRGQPGVRGSSHPQRGHLPQSAGADRGGDHVGAGSLPPGRYGGGVRRGDQAGEIQTRFLRRHHRVGQSHRQAV